MSDSTFDWGTIDLAASAAIWANNWFPDDLEWAKRWAVQIAALAEREPGYNHAVLAETILTKIMYDHRAALDRETRT